MAVEVQKQFTANPSPASAVVLIAPATMVSTSPIDICPTWFRTIGPARIKVARSSSLIRGAGLGVADNSNAVRASDPPEMANPGDNSSAHPGPAVPECTVHYFAHRQ
jgi:hypothetical protein